MDPYRLHNLKMDDYPLAKEQLLNELAEQLKKTEDPWYNEKILADMIPYH